MKIILTYSRISSLTKKLSTAWKILVTENKTVVLKDPFITVGQSGKKKKELKNAFEKYSEVGELLLNCN